MDKTSYQAPKGRLLSTVVIVVFAVVALYSLFLWFERITAQRELKRLGEEIQNVETEIQKLEAQRIQELVVAQDTEDLVKSQAVVWSKVIRRLQDLTPVTVFFKTYSASLDGQLELTGLADNYEAVADVIRVFTESGDFDSVFAPNLAQGVSSDGATVVSFGLELHSVIE